MRDVKLFVMGLVLWLILFVISLLLPGYQFRSLGEEWGVGLLMLALFFAGLLGITLGMYPASYKPVLK